MLALQLGDCFGPVLLLLSNQTLINMAGDDSGSEGTDQTACSMSADDKEAQSDSDMFAGVQVETLNDAPSEANANANASKDADSTLMPPPSPAVPLSPIGRRTTAVNNGHARARAQNKTTNKRKVRAQTHLLGLHGVEGFRQRSESVVPDCACLRSASFANDRTTDKIQCRNGKGFDGRTKVKKNFALRRAKKSSKERSISTAARRFEY